MLILCYVDEPIFTLSFRKLVENVVESFLKRFEGKRNPSLSWYLGVHIQLSAGQCIVSQSSYVHQIMKHNLLENVRNFVTPMSSKFCD